MSTARQERTYLKALAKSGEITPQARTVARHLADKGTLTGVEAEQVYRIRHLPRRIADLRLRAASIKSVPCKDPTGQRYVRYTVVGCGALKEQEAF